MRNMTDFIPVIGLETAVGNASSSDKRSKQSQYYTNLMAGELPMNADINFTV
jgi:hypothetical protein